MNNVRTIYRKHPIAAFCLFASVVVALPSVHATAGASTDAAVDEPQYVLQDGKVDKATFNGYRRFHGTCHACHGQDAMGSSFAPALAESLKTVTYAVFTKTVLEGRQSTSATGAASAMPAFGKDPNITNHLDDIYRYLRARAVGGLGPGRPPKLPKPK